MFSEGSPRPTLRFSDTKFIWMCGKDLEAWQIKWAPLSPSEGKASSCGKFKCMSLCGGWREGGGSSASLPVQTRLWGDCTLFPSCLERTEMFWLLLAPATAYIQHQYVLDLSVGQNHLETITKTSTKSVSPGFNFHNGTQETILEFPVAIVLLAWGSRQHPQPGKEFYNTSFSFFQRGGALTLPSLSFNFSFSY